MSFEIHQNLMMDVSEEVRRAVWDISSDFIAPMDAPLGSSDYREYMYAMIETYLPGALLYRFLSENICNYVIECETNSDFDYAKMSDKEAKYFKDTLVGEKGFFIPPSELFCNVQVRATNDENINETLKNVFRHIEESSRSGEAEEAFCGLFDDFDVNSIKLGTSATERNEIVGIEME